MGRATRRRERGSGRCGTYVDTLRVYARGPLLTSRSMRQERLLSQSWSRWVGTFHLVADRSLNKQDLDRIELALQAVEYERCEPKSAFTKAQTDKTAQDVQSLNPFFAGSIRELTTESTRRATDLQRTSRTPRSNHGQRRCWRSAGRCGPRAAERRRNERAWTVSIPGPSWPRRKALKTIPTLDAADRADWTLL